MFQGREGGRRDGRTGKGGILTALKGNRGGGGERGRGKRGL